jgi:hypothetical protein
MAREEDGFFDDLARGLADGSLTRGKALKLMGAAVVGGTLGSLGIGGVAVADEECKPTGKKCRKNAQCCSGICSGGTCQAQTTTTTTSTSTTSTSTSTTSTSTTPMCIPTASSTTCTADNQCCSGNCCGTSTGSPGRCYQHASTPCTTGAQCCGSCFNGTCFDR